MLHQGRDNKHHRPGKKAAGGDDGARGAGLMRIPEIKTASQVNDEENRIYAEIEVAARLPAKHPQLGSQCELKSHCKPTQCMLGISYVKEPDGQRAQRDEYCASVKRPS